MANLKNRILLQLVQLSDGARALARFTGRSHTAREIPSPPVFSTLKRRQRRAPGTPNPCHSVVRSSIIFAFVAWLPSATWAQTTKPVSYHRDIVPLLKRSCTGCHHPGKLKGELDVTTYAAFLKGGKHGAAFKAGAPKDSRVIEEISGDEPSMPKEGISRSEYRTRKFGSRERSLELDDGHGCWSSLCRHYH